MITFKNKKAINEWMVSLENNLTLLKARLVCEENQCKIVDYNTDGFKHKEKAIQNAKSVKDCADMIIQYLKTN